VSAIATDVYIRNGNRTEQTELEVRSDIFDRTKLELDSKKYT